MNVCCPRCGSRNIDEGVITYATCLECNWDGPDEDLVDPGSIIDNAELRELSRCAIINRYGQH